MPLKTPVGPIPVRRPSSASFREPVPDAPPRNDLNDALRLHRAGDLGEAEARYRGLLDRQPRNEQALHLLGVLLLQRGNAAGAIELIGRALAIRPAEPSFLAHAAEAFRALGRLREAAQCCQEALRLRADFPKAANSLGLILLAQGQASQAAEQFRRALRFQPHFAQGHNNFGNALRLLGDRDGVLGEFLTARGEYDRSVWPTLTPEWRSN
jgi:tetratricopeptide (TPR) repeat protein